MRLTAAIALLGLAIPVSAVASGPAPNEAAPAVASIDAVVVRTEDIDEVATMEALRLRAPQRALQPAGRARPEAKLFAVAEIRMKDEDTVALVVILSDRRAYYRDV